MIDKSNYHHIQFPHSLISIASLWINRGSSEDPKGKEGLSHYFEHLFLNKTKTLSNHVAVLRKIDGMGIFLNAFTKKNSIHYYCLQQPKIQEQAYDMIISGLEDFSIEEKDVAREKEVIINEQNQFTSNPRFYIWNLADQGLWPDSPLSDSGLGTKESISSISRADILQHRDILFIKENIGFLTISPLKISSSLKHTLTEHTSQEKSVCDPTSKHIFTKNSNKLLCKYSSLDTIFLTISFPLPGTKELLKDKITLDFIRNYLVSGWSSKCIERLRLEKNYTYWVNGGIESFYEAGSFKISLSTTKKYVSEIIHIIVEEIQKIQEIEMNEEELLHHKNAMKSHTMIKLVQPENILLWHGWNIFTANYQLSIEKYLSLIDTIHSSEIRSCAQTYLQIHNLHVATLGNIKETDISI